MPSILLVEDEFLVAMDVSQLLEAAGFEVRRAQNGAVALAALDDGFRPDVIVIDRMMPIMNGPALAKAVRQRAEHESVPLVILTAFSPESLPADTPHDAYLQKPVSKERLVGVVKALSMGRPASGEAAGDRG